MPLTLHPARAGSPHQQLGVREGSQVIYQGAFFDDQEKHSIDGEIIYLNRPAKLAVKKTNDESTYRARSSLLTKTQGALDAHQMTLDRTTFNPPSLQLIDRQDFDAAWQISPHYLDPFKKAFEAARGDVRATTNPIEKLNKFVDQIVDSGFNIRPGDDVVKTYLGLPASVSSEQIARSFQRFNW